MKLTLVFLAAFLAGCAGPRPAGRESLDVLYGGMTMEAVIRELGEPTARVEMRLSGRVDYDLSYVDTVVDPGVVELYFRPNLSEIVIDSEIYREF